MKRCGVQGVFDFVCVLCIMNSWVAGGLLVGMAGAK